MVIENIKTVWVCPYCSQQYDDEDEARDCARDCAEVDSPEEDTIAEYTCEMCKKIFDDELEAEQCENFHAEERDRHWYNWQHEEEMKKLVKAGSHPYQKKLLEE